MRPRGRLGIDAARGPRQDHGLHRVDDCRRCVPTRRGRGASSGRGRRKCQGRRRLHRADASDATQRSVHGATSYGRWREIARAGSGNRGNRDSHQLHIFLRLVHLVFAKGKFVTIPVFLRFPNRRKHWGPENYVSSLKRVDASPYILRQNSRFTVTTSAAITTVAPNSMATLLLSVARLMMAPRPMVE